MSERKEDIREADMRDSDKRWYNCLSKSQSFVEIRILKRVIGGGYLRLGRQCS